jgi:hypothetical protein
MTLLRQCLSIPQKCLNLPISHGVSLGTDHVYQIRLTIRGAQPLGRSHRLQHAVVKVETFRGECVPRLPGTSNAYSIDRRTLQSRAAGGLAESTGQAQLETLGIGFSSGQVTIEE